MNLESDRPEEEPARPVEPEGYLHVRGGKFTFYMGSDGKLGCFRHKDPWPAWSNAELKHVHEALLGLYQRAREEQKATETIRQFVASMFKLPEVGSAIQTAFERMGGWSWHRRDPEKAREEHPLVQAYQDWLGDVRTLNSVERAAISAFSNWANLEAGEAEYKDAEALNRCLRDTMHALRDVLRHAGVLDSRFQGDQCPSGPELILAAQDFCAASPPTGFELAPGDESEEHYRAVLPDGRWGLFTWDPDHGDLEQVDVQDDPPHFLHDPAN